LSPTVEIIRREITVLVRAKDNDRKQQPYEDGRYRVKTLTNQKRLARYQLPPHFITLFESLYTTHRDKRCRPWGSHHRRVVSCKTIPIGLWYQECMGPLEMICCFPIVIPWFELHFYTTKANPSIYHLCCLLMFASAHRR
jgi:hypothetical protein